MKHKIFTQNLRNNLLLLLLALALSVVIWLFAMQAASPLYQQEYADIPITVIGGFCDKESEKAVFTATKADLYDYRADGIRAVVDLTGRTAGNSYMEALRFYHGDTEIFPVTEVTVMVTVAAE